MVDPRVVHAFSRRRVPALKRLFADQLVFYLDLVRDIADSFDILIADAPNRDSWIQRLEQLQPNIHELELDASGSGVRSTIGRVTPARHYRSVC